jgi:hypothetical protein
VPGAADGAGGGLATIGYSDQMRLTPLTVGFHETQFLEIANTENQELLQLGQPALWDGTTRQKHNAPMGPANPQALNRYAYCLNNPLRYVDPTGHDPYQDGNENLGWERVKDENGDWLMVDGQYVYRIWMDPYFDGPGGPSETSFYVLEDWEHLGEVQRLIGQFKGAFEGAVKAGYTVGGSTLGFLVSGGITVATGNPISAGFCAGFAVGVVVSAGWGLYKLNQAMGYFRDADELLAEGIREGHVLTHIPMQSSN